MSKQSNIPLIVGISIPIAMVLFVAGSIYIPGMFIKPKTDFVYSTNNNNRYSCLNYYEVRGQTLTRLENPQETYANAEKRVECEPPFFYRYSVATGESTPLTLKEATAIKLDSRNMSPDGFEVIRGNYGGGGLFSLFEGGSHYNEFYLRGHNVSKKIMLSGIDTSYYYDDFIFLGWILPS